MAIYHFRAQTISRAKGRNAVAAAAYRHGQKFLDKNTGQVFNSTKKQDIVHTELIFPEEAPKWVKELAQLNTHKASQKLWNAVESFEKRKDAQTAREIEFALPHELTKEQRLELARNFIRENFTSKGMIADFVIHNHFDKKDRIEKPHVHVMLTMRELKDPEHGVVQKLKSYIGLSVYSSSNICFGKKVRDWNSNNLLEQWRKNWADCANHHLAKAGLDIRIDHRSYKEQGIDLEPQPKLGKSVIEMSKRGLYVDRFQEMREVQERNRVLIRKNPEIVLDYLTRYQSTFTRQDIAKVLNRYIDKAEEFRNLLGRIEASKQLVTLTGNEQGTAVKLTTKEMIKTESQIAIMASTLSEKHSCPPHLSAIDWYIEKGNERLKDYGGLSIDQIHAIKHMVSDGQLKVIVGYAGSGKTTSLEIAKEIWSSSGYRIVGAAPTGRAASNLEALGISSKTLHTWEYEWQRDREQLNNRSILILDEAGMVDSKRLHSLLKQSQEKGFKIVLVGDPEQLSPIEAGAPTRAIMEQIGFAELSNVVRQKETWQQEATKLLAIRQTEKALEAYHQNNHIHYGTNAKEKLIRDWAADLKENKQNDKQNRADKDHSKLILAYTNKDVKDLNQLARSEARKTGQLLGHDQVLTITKALNLETLDKVDVIGKKGTYKAPKVVREDRVFAVGDQVVFLKNDYGLDIRNGQLGKITDIQEGFLTILKEDKKSVTFDIDQYGYIDYGYATTIHKSQGTTVDKTFVYASSGMDSHLTYVALSRHKDGVQIYADTDSFYNKQTLFKELSKDTPKENVFDCLDPSLEEYKGFMQRRSISSSAPTSYMSWESIKETAYKAWSNTKDWMFGEIKQDKKDQNFIEDFQNLLKERSALPPILYRTQEQKKLAVKIGEKLEQIGYKIYSDPNLRKSAASIEIEDAVKVSANSYNMKLTQAKEKSLGLDQGLGLEMSLSMDNLFANRRNLAKDEK